MRVSQPEFPHRPFSIVPAQAGIHAVSDLRISAMLPSAIIVVGEFGDPRLRYWVPIRVFSAFLADRIKKPDDGMHDINKILRGDKASASKPSLPCVLTIN